MTPMRKAMTERDGRIAYWLTDKGDLESFVVPCSPEGYFIGHAGKLYHTLTEAEVAARGSYRVITYGPLRTHLEKE